MKKKRKSYNFIVEVEFKCFHCSYKWSEMFLEGEKIVYNKQIKSIRVGADRGFYKYIECKNCYRSHIKIVKRYSV